MSSKLRSGQYNWLGQKLLAQHQYGDILRLRQYLDGQHQRGEHLTYVHSIALMKTSTRLDEIVFTIQRMNFYKNSHYFLLMCQCLLYLGNYDSVVALCKQIIGKEIDCTCFPSQDSRDEHVAAPDVDTRPRSSIWSLESVPYESVEFKRFLATVSRTNLMKEPRLWFVFGLCLEYQRQFRDANIAYRLAAKLSTGSARRISRSVNSSGLGTNQFCANYLAPLMRSANFCLERTADIKSAQHILLQATGTAAQNHIISPLLSLVTSVQPQVNPENFTRALETINALESHDAAYRNPSLAYNNLALRCRRRVASTTFLEDVNREIGDTLRSLDYLLIRSHLTLNSLVQNSSKSCLFYKLDQPAKPAETKQQQAQTFLFHQIDQLIDLLRNSNASCRTSASFWNNLGICLFLRRRFVACLSCLLRASQLSPIDWRINYNLALAYLHVGLTPKGMVALMAARAYQPSMQIRPVRATRTPNPITTSLLAVCFDKLQAPDEARRLYLEATGACKANSTPVPVIIIVNYLAHVHKFSGKDDEQSCRLKLRLLDQLEQNWLQRKQHDPQFNIQLMELAHRIGNETIESQRGSFNRKTYAWTKALDSI